jgi:hypothetical protein
MIRAALSSSLAYEAKRQASPGIAALAAAMDSEPTFVRVRVTENDELEGAALVVCSDAHAARKMVQACTHDGVSFIRVQEREREVAPPLPDGACERSERASEASVRAKRASARELCCWRRRRKRRSCWNGASERRELCCWRRRADERAHEEKGLLERARVNAFAVNLLSLYSLRALRLVGHRRR